MAFNGDDLGAERLPSAVAGEHRQRGIYFLWAVGESKQMRTVLNLQAVLKETRREALTRLTYEQLQLLESSLHHVEGWVREERRSRPEAQK